MKLKCLPISATAASMALVIAGTATAQAQGPMMGDREWGGMGWGMWRGGPGPWGRGPDGMLDRIEGRLAFIKAELKIAEAQTTAWNQLAEAIRTAAKNHNARRQAIWGRQDQARTLPERLEAREQLVSARLEEIRQIKGALGALYAVLSDEQKKEADEIVLPMAGMGGHRWWGR